MATINFIIQSENNPAGIYVRLREGRKIDVKAKTKYAIDPANWSGAKGQPKNLNDKDLKTLNENLSKLNNRLLTHFNNCPDKDLINTQWLKDFIKPPKTPETIPSKLVEYFEYYAKHKKSSIEASTQSKIYVNKNLLERFQTESKTVFLIKDVNADFKLRFEEYCIKEKYAPNTIARAIKFIKTICYHARNNGIETHYQLNSIVGKTEKVEKIFLTTQEIEIIQKTSLEHDYLINARDWLVISCETGQRVSDFMRFTTDQIRYETIKGPKGSQKKVPLIEFTQVKTNKIMSIPLSGKVMDILKRRGNKFPRKISDQNYNEYIKDVCKIAELNEKIKGSKIDTVTKRKANGLFPKHELVTSHIGRRSFATNNYGTIPTSLLINVTGHSTESMFLEYIGKTETEKAIQLAAYF